MLDGSDPLEKTPERDYAELLAEFIIHAYRFITFFSYSYSHNLSHLIQFSGSRCLFLFCFICTHSPSKQTLYFISLLARRHDVLSFYKCHFPSPHVFTLRHNHKNPIMLSWNHIHVFSLLDIYYLASFTIRLSSCCVSFFPPLEYCCLRCLMLFCLCCHVRNCNYN